MPNRSQRGLGGFEQCFRADRTSGGMHHPQIWRDVSHFCHAFKLGADRSCLLHLLFNLKRDHMSDGIVGQVEERVDHVSVNAEQHYVFLMKDRSVVLVPSVFRNLHRGIVKFFRSSLRMVVHPMPDRHIH